jgi:hypothetical protein
MSQHSPTCASCSNLVAEPAGDDILSRYCFAHAFSQCYTPRRELRYCPSCDESEFFSVAYQITVPDLSATLRTSDFSCSFAFEGNDPDEAFYCNPDVPVHELDRRLAYIIRSGHPRDIYFWHEPDSHELSNRPAHLNHNSNAALRESLSLEAHASLTRTGDYGYCDECGDSWVITD